MKKVFYFKESWGATDSISTVRSQGNRSEIPFGTSELYGMRLNVDSMSWKAGPCLFKTNHVGNKAWMFWRRETQSWIFWRRETQDSYSNISNINEGKKTVLFTLAFLCLTQFLVHNGCWNYLIKEERKRNMEGGIPGGQGQECLQNSSKTFPERKHKETHTHTKKKKFKFFTREHNEEKFKIIVSKNLPHLQKHLYNILMTSLILKSISSFEPSSKAWLWNKPLRNWMSSPAI